MLASSLLLELLRKIGNHKFIVLKRHFICHFRKKKYNMRERENERGKERERKESERLLIISYIHVCTFAHTHTHIPLILWKSYCNIVLYFFLLNIINISITFKDTCKYHFTRENVLLYGYAMGL
jgi:hypothetical protein